MISKIQRGTTPTLDFVLPLGSPEIIAGTITLSQRGNAIVKKPFSEWVINGNTISVTLTQEDTLLINTKYPVEIQLKPKFINGVVPDTDIHTLQADKVLDEVVI